MTAGQRAMAISGQLHSVLVYNAVEMSDEDLIAQLAEAEKECEPLSVYFGTDMNLLEGAIGVTSEALREEAATGNKWFACFTGNMAGDITISSLFGAGGVVLASVSAHFLRQQYIISNTELTTLEDYTLWFNNNEIGVRLNQLNQGKISQEVYEESIKKFVAENNALHAKVTVSTSTVVLSSIGVVVGLAMIGFSIYSIVQIVDKYNPRYTKIPSNMVDTVETANGNRYINYTVVNSLYKNGDETAEKPGDLNAYDGVQWNAIYYTKSYEAGKCMTATGYFLDSADSFGKYTPVAKFGAKNCYDLNSFNDNDNTDKIFVAFGNSNNKKTAETSIPTVVGSIYTFGASFASGVLGLCFGMAIMGVIKSKKKVED